MTTNATGSAPVPVPVPAARSFKRRAREVFAALPVDGSRITHEEIGVTCGLSTRTVQRAIHDLVFAGKIKVTCRRGLRGFTVEYPGRTPGLF